MRHFRGVRFIGSGLVLVACGTSTTPPSSFEEPTPAPSPRSGHYEISNGPALSARVDLDDESVVVWPPFQRASVMAARSLTSIEGRNLRVPLYGGGALLLPIDDDGALGGSYRTVDANEHLVETGLVGPDRVAPDVRAAWAVGRTMFPWDVFPVTFSEPIGIEAIAAGVGIRGATTTVEPTFTDGWSTTNTTELASLRAKTWADVVGKTTSLDVGPLADPAGNASALRSFALTFANMQARPSFDFTDGATPFAVVSSAGLPTTFESGEPACGPGGSCLALGPFDACGSFSSGAVAGWLVASATITHIHVRYRVLEHDGDGVMAASTAPASITIVGDDDVPTALPLVDSTLPLSPTTDLGMDRASDWATATFATRAPTIEVGFTFGFGILCPDDYRIGSSPDYGTATILVSSVTAD